MMCFNAVSLLSCLGGQKFWILWQAWTDIHFCPLPWWGIRNSEYSDNHEQISIFVPCRDWESEILNPCGIKVDSWFCSVTVSCSCFLILGIRNSEYFYNHEQIAVFVPHHDGGSEILNPCGIKNRLLFCSVKLWAGGSEILNLSKKESAIGARSPPHEFTQFDRIGKLHVLLLVDTTEHFFFFF